MKKPQFIVMVNQCFDITSFMIKSTFNPAIFIHIRLFFFFSDYTYIVNLPVVNLIFENSDV